jgi:aminodeoxychorismate lyase
MLVFLNGRFVPEEQALVSVFDRGFLYGDGLFETMRLFNGRPFRWDAHVERLQRGAAFLQIQVPFAPESLRHLVNELVVRNQMQEGLLRLTLSRGIGVRGYSPAGANRPVLVMTLHPAPTDAGPRAWDLVTSSVRLPAGQTLAQFKTCNKLAQIMARAEADAAGAQEALLLNTDGNVVEGSSSNLFWVASKGAVCTPALASGILPGVTRAVVTEICESLGIAMRECSIGPQDLKRCAGVFLALSSQGVVSARTLDATPLPEAAVVGRIQADYARLIQAECGGADSSGASR